MREFIRYSMFSDNSESRKPERTRVINQDDIVNLQISLHTAEDVMDLIKDEHIFCFKCS